MKKKFLILFLILIFILSYSSINFSYAVFKTTDIPKESDNFLASDNTELCTQNNLVLNIDLTKIDLENFKLSLSSGTTLNKPVISDLSDTDIDFDNNILEMLITKDSLKLDSFTLTYILPQNINIGDIINISASIYQISDDTQTLFLENNLSFTIVEEEQKNEDVNTQTPDKQSGQMMNASTVQVSSNQMSSNQSVVKSYSSVASGASETVSYNGSSNNYLSNLAVNGYDFTSDFSKTNFTYFLTVTDSTSFVNIITTAEDSSATVCVYGNSDLKSGLNKVLINVTSENGNVKTYRIYITKE